MPGERVLDDVSEVTLAGKSEPSGGLTSGAAAEGVVGEDEEAIEDEPTSKVELLLVAGETLVNGGNQVTSP